VKVLYFAWVRERVGKAEEEVDPPAGVCDALGWFVLLLLQPASVRQTAKVVSAVFIIIPCRLDRRQFCTFRKM